jgi:hypothetical protein
VSGLSNPRTKRQSVTKKISIYNNFFAVFQCLHGLVIENQISVTEAVRINKRMKYACGHDLLRLKRQVAMVKQSLRRKKKIQSSNRTKFKNFNWQCPTKNCGMRTVIITLFILFEYEIVSLIIVFY